MRTSPEGKVIANEHWDDGLPMRVEGKDGFGSWGYKGLSSSSDGSMQMYSEDVPEKRELLYKWLNEADYLVLSSNRLWGSIPRLPMRYPMTTLYYKLLFEGKLGFKQVGHFTSFPTIFGVPFNDTGAEEAFSVYDHPEVYIFEKTPEYSEALARSYFDPDRPGAHAPDVAQADQRRADRAAVHAGRGAAAASGRHLARYLR